MTSKAARRKCKGGMPRKEGPREPSGRPSRTPAEDVRLVVIEARLRHGGDVLTPGEAAKEAARLATALDLRELEDRAAAVTAIAARVKAKRKRAALDPLLCTPIGMCIAAAPDRQLLSEIWAALTAAHRTWRERNTGLTGDPKSAAIALQPEPMQTDPGYRVDLRTPEEKDEAARRAWGMWEARIKAIPVPQHRWAVRGALLGFTGDGALWRDRKPTALGLAAVAGLRAMGLDAKPE